MAKFIIPFNLMSTFYITVEAENKEKAIEFLVKALLDVDLIVPDVVIGRFAHKLLINK
jgi:mannitol/fructose-specific phosphotransferase system IIA component (Ntr-type)